jgi:hypothetical protein
VDQAGVRQEEMQDIAIRQSVARRKHGAGTSKKSDWRELEVAIGKLMESLKQPASVEQYYTDALLHRTERAQQCLLNWQLFAVSCRGRAARYGFQPCDDPLNCGVKNRTKTNEEGSDLHQGVVG